MSRSSNDNRRATAILFDNSNIVVGPRAIAAETGYSNSGRLRFAGPVRGHFGCGDLPGVVTGATGVVGAAGATAGG